MATVFRAIVMLVVLVGLPSAWVYYGPLPPTAMGVIERTVASAKKSIGWDDRAQATSWAQESTKTAPRFDTKLVEASETLRQSYPEPAPRLPTRPVVQDSQFSLASATVPAQSPQATSAEVDQELARQLEPHLSLLRSLNAAQYTLENWGGDGQLYRFRCAVTLTESDDHTRQFEAIHANPLRAVHQVVGEVTAWQNARHSNTTTRWQ